MLSCYNLSCSLGPRLKTCRDIKLSGPVALHNETKVHLGLKDFLCLKENEKITHGSDSDPFRE